MPTSSRRPTSGTAPTNVIVLWDIDNTLLYTGGAGSLAMARAFVDLYGIEDAFRRIEFSGRTDTAIFSDAARAHGIAEDRVAEEIQRFLSVYLDHLAETLRETIGGRLMPGVAALLDELGRRQDVAQGLGTGNFRDGGAMKLRHYGIDRHFPGMPGGFGEDSEDRAAVIACAIERLRNGAGHGPVVVIGDTPHDVTAARANDAFALGVATGRHTVEELRGAGANAALPDLADVGGALRIVLG